MTELHERRPETANRRNVLIGAGSLGAGVVLTACAGGQSEPSASSTSGVETTLRPDTVQVDVADVAVGGGVVLRDAKVVVTQPQAGQFHAFSAVCTHKQCLVSEVADGTIDCPCHGSRFSVVDGTVVRGPATQPLPVKTVTVNGGSLTVS